MATYTTNYNLTKPSNSDNVSITPLDNNFDTIDAALHANAMAIGTFDAAINANTAAIGTFDAAINANTAAISTKMPIAGGTFSGTVKMNGALILNSSTYGTELPASGVAGQIFFKKV